MKKVTPILLALFLFTSFTSPDKVSNQKMRLPDLAVKVDVCWLDPGEQRIYFRVTVINSSPVFVDAKDIVLESYFSTDKVIGNDIRRGGATMPAFKIAPGRSKSIPEEFWINYSGFNLADYPYIVVAIDVFNTMQERNEENNKTIYKHNIAL
jgi:hypothetical protein